MKNRIELAQYFAKLGFRKGAEIGVHRGYYSKVLLNTIPNLNLLCVDRWSTALKKNLRSYKSATILRGYSMDVVKHIVDESLDFVFIDASHDYESVRNDIRQWSEKIMGGGIVSGHDYFIHPKLGVVEAVNEYVSENGYQLKLTKWDKQNQIEDDRQPSWYFVKRRAQ